MSINKIKLFKYLNHNCQEAENLEERFTAIRLLVKSETIEKNLHVFTIIIKLSSLL